MKKVLNVGSIDEAMEEGRIELTSVPSVLFSKDSDAARDREVARALQSLNFQRVKGDIGEVVRYVLEAVHDNARYQRMLSMPHYAKIADDVITDIYLKHYT